MSTTAPDAKRSIPARMTDQLTHRRMAVPLIQFVSIITACRMRLLGSRGESKGGGSRWIRCTTMTRTNMTALPDDEWMKWLQESFEREAERNLAASDWYRKEAAALREKLKDSVCVKE